MSVREITDLCPHHWPRPGLPRVTPARRTGSPAREPDHRRGGGQSAAQAGPAV